MLTELYLQQACDFSPLPTEADFTQWVNAALRPHTHTPIALCIRLVDNNESAELNLRYRKKAGPTNILSFPQDWPDFDDDQTHPQERLLGDLVMCAPLIAEEALAQNKTPAQHWAHLTIHGVLHLLGYDHAQEPQATEMENLEIAILKQLNYPNPYQ